MEKFLAVFFDLLQCKTTTQVDELLNKHKIDKQYHFSEKKYPKLHFKITQDEIMALVSTGKISSDYKNINTEDFSPMEKLLYALIWKQGDINKIEHITRGIMSSSDEDVNDAIVFNQFGRHLSGDREEPIVDQHVLRAYSVYKNHEDEKKVKHFRQLKKIAKKHSPLIQEYKSWLSIALTLELRQDPEYAYHVDKVLFSLGKYIKQ